MPETMQTETTTTTPAPAPGTQPPPAFATISVTNSLTTAVEIFDEFNPSTATSPQPIVYTSLGVIQAGATGSVKSIRQVALLVAAITGTIDELNGNYYHRFPVKAMSGTLLKYAPQTLTYTITADDRTAAIASFKFQRYVVANPDAALTKNFTDALKGGYKTVDAFFKASKSFTQCTMASWHTVVTWLGSSTSGWQGPYYLYEVAPSPVPADFTPHLVATLNILSDATNDSAVLTMCAADASGNPVFATPSQLTTLTMAGDSTLQDADPGGDVPVVLTPIWMNVISTPMVDGTPVPKFLIGPAFSGTVAGSHVVSSQTARQVPGKEPKSKSETSDFDKGFNKLGQIVGLLAGLAMLYDFAKKKYTDWKEKKEEARDEADDAQELEEHDENIDAEAVVELNNPQDGIAVRQAAGARNVADLPVMEAEEVHEEMVEVVENNVDANVAQVESAVQAQVAESGVAPSQPLEDAVNDVEARADAAREAAAAGNVDAVEPLEQAIQNLQQVSAAEESSVQQDVSRLQKAAADGEKQMDKLEEAEAKHESDSDESDEDAVDESEDEEPSAEELPKEV